MAAFVVAACIAAEPEGLAPLEYRRTDLAVDLGVGLWAWPIPCDADSDGDFDLVSGNTAGYLEWFENLSGPGIERPSWSAPRRLEAAGKTFRVMAGENGSIQGPAEAKWGYTTFQIGD